MTDQAAPPPYATSHPKRKHGKWCWSKNVGGGTHEYRVGSPRVGGGGRGDGIAPAQRLDRWVEELGDWMGGIERTWEGCFVITGVIMEP